jgi:hypothetical protein
MVRNVFNHLADKNRNLLEKICTNDQLASLIMGLVKRLVYVCVNEKSFPVEGMSFSPWNVSGGEVETFTSHVTFSPIFMLREKRALTQKSDFREYVGHIALEISRAMENNPEIEKWAQELIERIDNFAAHKAIPFADLEFKEHIITMQDVVVLKIGKREGAHLAVA